MKTRIRRLANGQFVVEQLTVEQLTIKEPLNFFACGKWAGVGLIYGDFRLARIGSDAYRKYCYHDTKLAASRMLIEYLASCGVGYGEEGRYFEEI